MNKNDIIYIGKEDVKSSMVKDMKSLKRVMCFVFAIFMGILPVNAVSNSDVLDEVQYEDFSEFEEKGLRFEFIDEDNFNIYIPASLVDVEQMDEFMEIENDRSRGASSSSTIEIIGTTCFLMSLPVKDFDPCKWMVQKIIELGKTEYRGIPDGVYIVSRTYIPGRVPGCEPIHSGPCNSGYYKINYARKK